MNDLTYEEVYEAIAEMEKDSIGSVYFDYNDKMKQAYIKLGFEVTETIYEGKKVYKGTKENK